MVRIFPKLFLCFIVILLTSLIVLKTVVLVESLYFCLKFSAKAHILKALALMTITQIDKRPESHIQYRNKKTK